MKSNVKCSIILAISVFLFKKIKAITLIREATENEIFFHLFTKHYNSEEVKMSASLVGYPDLPSWLKFIQRNQSSNGFLYGTPAFNSQDVEIQVISIDQSTYEARKENIMITIKPNKDTVVHIAEFWVSNFYIEDLFQDDMYTRFLQQVSLIWKDKLSIVKIVSQTDPEFLGRLPIPPKPGDPTPVDGVVIQIGGSNISTELQQALNQSTSCLNDGAAIAINSLFLPHFHINWCRFKLKIRQTTKNQIGLLTDFQPSFTPRKEPSATRQFKDEFLVAILLPMVIATTFLILLSYVMFGHRQERNNRNRYTPNIQLEQYSIIRQSTTSLRQMSIKRNDPLSPNGGSIKRCPSTPTTPTASPLTHGSTPNRSRSSGASQADKRPPPAYQLPPIFADGRPIDE